MKIFLKKENMYLILIEGRVIYSFDKKDATDFANTTVESFIKMKKELEEREGVEFELEFA